MEPVSPVSPAPHAPSASGGSPVPRHFWAIAGFVALAGSLVARHIAPRDGRDFAIGAAFGLANILVMGGLVRAILRTGGALPKKAAIWAAVKFPVLYGALFAVLHWGHVDAMAFLAGFTAMLGALLITGLVPTPRRSAPPSPGASGASASPPAATTLVRPAHDTPSDT